ncbi:MAG: DUF4160 domain-containing protein [Proteobacteria bacterium]|nr:DUF4160 domain-containing protein [Pseudomonadota bacterium]
MPTVHRIDGLRVVIYPNDHRPAHVDVMGGDGEAVFVLNCPHGPVALRENHGFVLSAVNRIEAALSRELGVLCERWRAIHDGD